MQNEPWHSAAAQARWHHDLMLLCRSLIAAAAVLATAALLLPATAGAFHFQPGSPRWEISRIPYFIESPALRVPAVRAASKWNALGLRVRLVRVSDRRKAFVIMSTAGNGCFGGVTRVLEALETRVSGGRTSRLRYIARARMRIAPGCGLDLTVYVIAHEFGHVLGLAHEARRCALMNPSADSAGQSRQCPPRSLAARARNPLRTDDIRGVRALYRRALGGRLAAYRQFISF